MTTAIKRRRGTTAQHSTFTGLVGEITVDTTKNTVVVHDGTTAGGFPLQKEISTLPVANGGTGVTTSTGSGNNVLSTSPTLVTPVLGTPTSVTLTNATGLPLTTGVTGTLSVANGGTGITSIGTGVATALGVNVGSSGAFVTNGGALGTPSSGTLTNCTFPTLNQNTTGTAAGLSSTLNVASGGTGLTSLTAGYIPFGNGTSAFGNSSNLFWDSANARLGVGTSSPTTTFHTSTATSAFYVSDNFIKLFNKASNGNRVSFSDQSWASGIGGSAGELILYAGGDTTEKMRITGAGNVGIGTSSPTAKLDVYGSSVGELRVTSSTHNFQIYSNSDGTTLGTYTNAPLFFRTNATERLRIAADGSVGIGTSSPDAGAKMTIYSAGNTPVYLTSGDATNCYQYFKDGGSSAYQVAIGSSANKMKFVTGGAVNMLLDASGNVGIGVVPSAWGSSWRALQVATTGFVGAGVGSTDVQIGSNAYNTGTGTSALKYIAGDYASMYRQVSGIHSWFTAPSGTAGNAISFTQAMTLDGSGQLFLNATSGINGCKLQIKQPSADKYGAIFFASANDAFLQIGHTGSVGAVASTYNTTAGFTPLTFWTGDTERMRIDTLGNVSIGTTSVFYGLAGRTSLSINGTNQSIVALGNGGNAKGYLYNDGTNFILSASNSMYYQLSGTGQHVFVQNAGAIENMRIDSNGNVGIGTATVSYKLQVNGSFAATTKSFVIDHPTKPGMKLRYGSLESPYHGVRLTGRDTIRNRRCIINLPDYINALCKEENINVQLTNIKHGNILWVEEIDLSNNEIVIGTDAVGEYDFFWSFTGTRKDVDDMVVEFEA